MPARVKIKKRGDFTDVKTKTKVSITKIKLDKSFDPQSQNK